jgi:AraC-like DNA-binding protein
MPVEDLGPWVAAALARLEEAGRDMRRVGQRAIAGRREIANVLGVSPTRASREVFRHTGCHLSALRWAVVLRDAAGRLAFTDAAVKEIAIDCACTDPSHFDRVFEKILGMTPTAFRALGRDDS